MKKIILFWVFIILSSSLVFAHGSEISIQGAQTNTHSETFNQAQDIITSKVPCDQLNESQFELIGDYYMEQMHPGELHEIMDDMMGGDGSDSLSFAHKTITRTFYCGEDGAMPINMMNMMMGRTGFSSNMMNFVFNSMDSMMGSSFGMMNMMGENYNNYNKNKNGGNNMVFDMTGTGMMGGTGMFFAGLLGLVWFAVGAFVFSIVFWLTHNWLVDHKNKRRRR